MIKFEHTSISVTDINKTIEWYKINFEFELIREFEKPDLEVKGAVLKLGDFILEVLQSYSPEAHIPAGNSLISHFRQIGVNHIAVSVSNINEIYQKFKNNKIELVGELIGNKTFFCKDPDGILIEVRERK